MNRTELNEAVQSYLNKGGKITKLPDGPDFRFHQYGVKIPESTTVDTTANQDPINQKQLLHYENSKI